MISCTLLMILIVPRVIMRARPVATIIREFSDSQSNDFVCTPKLMSGVVAGVERIYAMVTIPLMMPTTKATTTAIC